MYLKSLQGFGLAGFFAFGGLHFSSNRDFMWRLPDLIYASVNRDKAVQRSVCAQK